ncbi:MAG: hypothetical protein AAGB18_01990, partial [Pseudomonadota bacterium]
HGQAQGGPFESTVQRNDVKLRQFRSVQGHRSTRTHQNAELHAIDAHINDHEFAATALRIFDDWREQGLV